MPKHMVLRTEPWTIIAVVALVGLVICTFSRTNGAGLLRPSPRAMLMEFMNRVNKVWDQVNVALVHLEAAGKASELARARQHAQRVEELLVSQGDTLGKLDALLELLDGPLMATADPSGIYKLHYGNMARALQAARSKIEIALQVLKQALKAEKRSTVQDQVRLVSEQLLTAKGHTGTTDPQVAGLTYVKGLAAQIVQQMKARR